MKNLILITVILLSSLSSQAKTLQERNEELTVLRQKVTSALAQGKSKRACFLSGQFHAKISEVIEVVSTQVGSTSDTDALSRLLPQLEELCRD